MCAGIGLIAGGAWYLLARDAPAEHPGVSAIEIDELASTFNTTRLARSKLVSPPSVVMRSLFLSMH